MVTADIPKVAATSSSLLLVIGVYTSNFGTLYTVIFVKEMALELYKPAPSADLNPTQHLWSPF